jgi:hypothetical protein
MTIDGRAAARLACLLLVAACSDAHATRRGDRVDVSSYPPDIQAAYRVFAVRCSRCHTLARPLNAHITDPQHWIRYVTRMRRQPGSGINADNADIILRFLLYYHREPDSEPAPDSNAPLPPPPAPAMVLPTDPPANEPAPPPPPAPEPPAPTSTSEDDGREP